MPALPIGVLVSGRGSNLQAILDAVAGEGLPVDVRLVVSNRSDALALERAAAAGVPTRVVSHRDFSTREGFEAALVTALREAGVEWVVLAGFMRVLTPTFLAAFPRRVLNIHPALLPSFPGTHAQAQALAYGVKVTGCTVHVVDQGVDTGPVIAQRAVPVLEGDDEASLAARILIEEHRLLVETLRDVAAGRIRIASSGEGQRARVTRG